MQYIGSNIRFIFTKIKELLNSHNTDNSAHSELFKSWTLLRDPTNAEIADALAVTHKNGRGDVLVHVANTQTFALEDMKLFFRPARLQLISATESNYEGIYITMDGTQGRYVAKTFADSEIMTPEGPSTISTPSELVLYPASSDAVLYTPQTLTEEQQEQARTNIGALDVNIKTTPVDIDVTLFGRGENIVYVKDGWLKPCPTDADNELVLQYRRVFELIGLQRLKPSSENILLEAKSAYALYQKGLASERIKVTNNPLRAAQVYVTWDITTRSNKHYVYYTQASTAYQYDCTYCVEDDALTSERYQCAIYSTSNGVGEQDSVSQFRMYTNPTEDMHIATKQYVDTAKTEAQQLGLTTATPGKTIRVKTVQDGKPTEWEVADIYEKPDTGIPKSDLEQSVQTSLDKADTAISYNSQTLTEEQQERARVNIGAGQSVFVVNVTGPVDGNYTADKTAAEIEAAYQAGRTIVCKTQARFVLVNIPVELPLVSRNQERVFIFSADQLMGENAIFSITVNISDSGVEVSTKGVEIYEKPASGIPKSDLADEVQTSLTKADSALQSVPDTYRTAEAQNIIDETKQTKTIADAGGYFGANPTVEGALQQLGANSGGGSGNPNAVLYIEQTLTNEQKAQARSNINAEEAGTSYTKSEVDTKLDEKINASNGKFKNTLSATTTDGTQLYQEGIRVGVLGTGNCIDINKTQINFYNRSGNLGLFMDASNIRNLETPSDDRDAANKKYVDDAVAGITVPTKTSELTNDSGFITSAQGVENAGKFLVVGNDGNITLKTLEAWQGGNY